MIGPEPGEPQPTSRWWVVIDVTRRLITGGLLALIAFGVLGQVVRDQSAAWGVLMYLPLPLIGAAAVGFDWVSRGRGLSRYRWRFALTMLGLMTVLGSSVRLVGWGQASTGVTKLPAARGTVEVLHWNVIWGGGRRRSPERWDSIRRTIQAQGADIVVLSEAPPDDWLAALVADLGPTGSRVHIENEPGASYWYRLAVCSARPLRPLRRATLRGGVAMSVEAETERGVLRLLVVDGQSHPLLWRTPFLLDVAHLCAEAIQAGRPYDLVVGDFNSLAESIGCDALAAEGYALASQVTLTWRGTFPSWMPVYDIDHVWVHRDRLAGLEVRLFTNLASDHRGQVVRLHD